MRRKRPFTEPDRIKERIKLVWQNEAQTKTARTTRGMCLDGIMRDSNLTAEFKVKAFKFHSACNPRPWYSK